jgi:hypothetical protein
MKDCLAVVVVAEEVVDHRIVTVVAIVPMVAKGVEQVVQEFAELEMH